uniref:SPIN-DOC-like zinc-finger domain-containing protein n=1 Tax=Oryzias latipes TaxID=8090 RepID=A0A3B3HDF5_ORYLA
VSKSCKRKKDEECRSFQDWTKEFAFEEKAGSAVCLICYDKIASMKRSNIKRHFDTRHAAFPSKYSAGDSKKKAYQVLLSRMEASQQQLRVWTQQGDWNLASFAAALAIVRNVASFTDGEFAKPFMLDIIKRIKDIPLSARTFHDQTIMMSNQIELTLVKDINAFSVIARYVVGDTLHEDSLAVLPLKGTTRGEDLFKSFNECHVLICPAWSKCRILSFNCILHQEALCAQMCGEQLGEVMSLAVWLINFIVARALNDRQFKSLLGEVGNSYPDLLLHSNVRWLSSGKVLSRFAACLSEIRTFLEMKNVGHPELSATKWLLKFYYLVDMTAHLDHLNVKMQGLELFIADIETGRLMHFEKLAEFKDACIASDPDQHLDLQQLAGFTCNLLQSFKASFGEFREHTRLFKFITHPHECAVDSTDLNYIPGVSVRDSVLQAADLKASDLWVNKFKSLNEDLDRLERQQAALANQLIVKTWNALTVTFFTLQRGSVAVLTMFGSTSACEQTFSHLKNIQTYLRSRLTDGSLNARMKLKLTTYQPD